MSTSTALPPRPSSGTSGTTGSPPLPVRRRSFGAWFKDTGWRHLVGLVMTAFALLPLAYVLSAALSPTGTLVASSGLFRDIGFANFQALFTDPQKPFARWFMNTLVIGLVTSAATVFLGALAAYSFSRMRFTGRRMGLLSLLLLQMFPQMLGVVAIFLLLSEISDIVPWLGLGSQLGLIMVYLGGALGVNTYLMYGFFNTVPKTLDEAARIDGAGHFQIFFTIILRLVTPILAIVGLLTFITTTGEFMIASIVLNDPDSQTLAVGLYSFVGDNQSRTWGVFSAGAVLAAVPVMALFLFLQRYIASGLVAGAVKG